MTDQFSWSHRGLSYPRSPVFQNLTNTYTYIYCGLLKSLKCSTYLSLSGCLGWGLFDLDLQTPVFLSNDFDLDLERDLECLCFLGDFDLRGETIIA